MPILPPISTGLGGGVPLLAPPDSCVPPWEGIRDWQPPMEVRSWNGVRRRVAFSESGMGWEGLVSVTRSLSGTAGRFGFWPLAPFFSHCATALDQAFITLCSGYLPASTRLSDHDSSLISLNCFQTKVQFLSILRVRPFFFLNCFF